MTTSKQEIKLTPMTTQLLYVFTTDGHAAVDGNVFYANWLVVDVPSLDSQATVDKIIAVALEGDHSPGYDITYVNHDEVDSIDLAAGALEEAGYEVNTITPTFVVGIEGDQ